MKRWVCPICSVGANGPARPRANATVRFCLTCSADSSTLVERVLPSREREKQKVREANEARARAAAEAMTIDGLQIDLEARRLTMLGCVRRAVRNGSWRVLSMPKARVGQRTGLVGVRIEILNTRTREVVRGLNSLVDPTANPCAAAVKHQLATDIAFIAGNFGECTARDVILAGFRGDERAAVLAADLAFRVSEVVDAQ